jgi:predicted ATPase
LPPELAGFTGRGAELGRLDELLADASAGAAAILAIDGTTGIGKPDPRF